MRGHDERWAGPDGTAPEKGNIMTRIFQDAASVARNTKRALRDVKRAMGKTLLAGVACASIAGPAQALELSYFTTVNNTDVATFGIGNLRGTGTGMLNVSGITGPISQAYLFWAGPTKTWRDDAAAYGTFGGTDITGTNIGFSDDNQWWTPYYESQAYRADVTPIVASGNGAYSIENFLGLNADMNGMSLIVFYDDGNAANNQDVVLFNGNDSNFDNFHDSSDWNAALNGLSLKGGAAELILHISDGQDFEVGPDDGTLIFNGTTLASGDIFNGDGVQAGTGTLPGNGALWDIERYDVTGLIAKDNSLTLAKQAYYPNGRQDAISLIVAQVNLAVGGTGGPHTPAVPEPQTWAMMIAGIGLIGAAMRRRSRRRLYV